MYTTLLRPAREALQRHAGPAVLLRESGVPGGLREPPVRRPGAQGLRGHDRRGGDGQDDPPAHADDEPRGHRALRLPLQHHAVLRGAAGLHLRRAGHHGGGRGAAPAHPGPQRVPDRAAAARAAPGCCSSTRPRTSSRTSWRTSGCSRIWRPRRRSSCRSSSSASPSWRPSSPSPACASSGSASPCSAGWTASRTARWKTTFGSGWRRRGRDGRISSRAGPSSASPSTRRAFPRLINIICDNALVVAYATSAKRVSAATVEEVASDLGLGPALPRAPRRRLPGPNPHADRLHAGRAENDGRSAPTAQPPAPAARRAGWRARSARCAGGPRRGGSGPRAVRRPT